MRERKNFTVSERKNWKTSRRNTEDERRDPAGPKSYRRMQRAYLSSKPHGRSAKHTRGNLVSMGGVVLWNFFIVV